MKFKLYKDELPFSFFNVIGLSLDEIIIKTIAKKFSNNSKSEHQDIFESYQDDLNQLLYDQADSDLLEYYWVGDLESDEGTETWACSEYEVLNTKEAKKKIEKEISQLIGQFFDENDLDK